MLRLVMLGTDDPYSCVPLLAVAEGHRVVAVGQPVVRGWRNRLARRFRPAALARAARRVGAEHWRLRHRADPGFVAKCAAAEPDLICISGFPWVLPQEVFEIPRLGTINLHNSLLPRYRGPLPLFWIYHGGDRETGVTVHWVDREADTGDIIAQSAFPLERGLSVEDLHRRNTVVGAEILVAALDAIDQETAKRFPQDSSAATGAPYPPRNTPMIDYDAWDVEQVWHFLAGLVTRRREPIVDDRGESVAYRSVPSYDRTAHDRPAGTAVRSPDGWQLYCRDGIVQLAHASHHGSAP